jgi:hypothetical protein
MKAYRHLNYRFADKTVLNLWGNCTCTAYYSWLVMELTARRCDSGEYFDLNSELLGINKLWIYTLPSIALFEDRTKVG